MAILKSLESVSYTKVSSGLAATQPRHITKGHTPLHHIRQNNAQRNKLSNSPWTRLWANHDYKPMQLI